MPTPTATTPPPGDLSGQYPFVDSVRYRLDQNNQTFANVDTGAGRFCLAGLVQGVDAGGALPSRRISFEYRSNGAIRKASSKTVGAAFDEVELTLTILENGVSVFSQTITPECKLTGRLRKAGESQKSRLRCDVGEFFSAFGLGDPASSGLRDSIERAFPKRSHVKLDVSKGKLRFTHTGTPAPSSVPVSLSCDLGGGGAG
jgi:hypothetical protein